MTKFQIIKFSFERKSQKIKEVDTLEEAQQMCGEPNTEGKDWFFGYIEVSK
jgi:hypothetical protein